MGVHTGAADICWNSVEQIRLDVETLEILRGLLRCNFGHENGCRVSYL